MVYDMIVRDIYRDIAYDPRNLKIRRCLQRFQNILTDISKADDGYLYLFHSIIDSFKLLISSPFILEP
ncbi:MAG: hypothetical protein LBE91_11015 [Tannerella sp.]|nr:hypothetical protein [Tannerella sp.]